MRLTIRKNLRTTILSPKFTRKKCNVTDAIKTEKSQLLQSLITKSYHAVRKIFFYATLFLGIVVLVCDVGTKVKIKQLVYTNIIK